MSLKGPPPVIAIVEDDASMRKAVERLLNAYGFATETFASAEAFLNRDPLCDPACLVLDVQLNGMSGLQLWAHLQASGCSVPVIFITALDNEYIEAAAKRAGCLAYLHKPFAADLLIDNVRRAMTGSQSD
jgi:FixJ family two-component response regulator